MSAATLADLEARRAELALAAAEGVEGARSDLEEIEGEIVARRLDEERARLARQALAAREAALEEKKRAAERAKLERQLETARSRLPKAAQRVDDALDGLGEAIGSLIAIGSEADRIARLLGTHDEHRPHVQPDRVAAILRGRLSQALPRAFEGSSLPWSRIAALYER